MRRRPLRLLISFAVIGLAVTVAAQGRRYRERMAFDVNVPYDGRFTMARIRYTPIADFRGFSRGDLKWDHDYPRSERNFSRILKEITYVNPNLEASQIFAADDPELMKYPIAYLCEVGYWTMTESEMAGLRAYLQKGGFLIVDDFSGNDWYNFEDVVKQLLPESRMVRLDASDPIFDSFYRIESLDFPHPNYPGYRSEFWGVYLDDKAENLSMIVNFNNDIGDYWEWSDVGFLPIDLTNEAYKLGVNYVMYAFTH
jgi:hypothetical protein